MTGEPRDRLPRDHDRGDDEHRRLGQRGQVLRLPVSVVVPAIGRPHRVPDREEGEQRGDEVGARMHRLGEQPK